MRRLGLFAALLLVAALAAPGAAGAYVAPGATVLSASLERQEQADDLTSAVTISGDGRYAVFQTRARNFFADDDPDPDAQFRFGGIFRRDIVTGALAVVAYGDLRPEADPATVLVRGAQNPSVSRDGRFVAFSTGAALVPQDANGNVDVYVRDMSLPVSDPAAFDLVSARDGGDVAASYGPPQGLDRPGVNPGAEVTLRSAISADGRFVTFRTPFVPSDLPAAAGAVVPEGQVYVRDRASDRTVLLTRDRITGDPAGGGVGAATISADGSTALWVGRNAPALTPYLNGEFADSAAEVLLWRRWDDGTPATRRVTGASDLDDPGCPPGSTYVFSLSATGPCYGPLALPESQLGSVAQRIPSMSADGRRVLFATAAAPRGLVVGDGVDLFLTDMSPGVSRKAGTVELTRDGLSPPQAGFNIDGYALSADARWVAFTTFRTQFVLPGYQFLGLGRSTADQRDIYLLDTAGRTIERALRAAAGGDADGSVGSVPAISDDGSRVVFTSDASNLFFGDANNRADAFLIIRQDAPPAEVPTVDPPQDTVESPQAPDAPAAADRLSVTVRRSGPGEVRLLVRAPRAGRVTAVARGRGLDAAGTVSGRARTLARGEVRASRRAQVTVRLRLSRTLRARLRRAGKLVAQAEVRFVAASGRPATRRVTVEFRP